MSLLGLITFIAGTKAKASEVNTNFSTVKSFVDGLETGLASNTSDITSLQNDKADLNGNASVRFAMADAVNNTDGVNKETLFANTHNAQRYINGLQIAKTANDTVSIQAGSTFDSTFTKEMILDASMSVQNTTQAVNSTYYMYLISKEDGTTQVIVSTEAVTPSLPSGYLYFRQIGKYFTFKATNDIAMVINSDEYIREKYDYANYTSYNTTSSSDHYFGKTFTAESDGLVVICTGFSSYIKIDGVTSAQTGFDSQGYRTTISLPVSRGQTYTFSGSSDGNFQYARFIPKIKYTL